MSSIFTTAFVSAPGSSSFDRFLMETKTAALWRPFAYEISESRLRVIAVAAIVEIIRFIVGEIVLVVLVLILVLIGIGLCLIELTGAISVTPITRSNVVHSGVARQTAAGLIRTPGIAAAAAPSGKSTAIAKALMSAAHH